MPLYEFRCKDCRRVFEKLVSVSAASEPQECPDCGGKEVSRLMSLFAAQAPAGMPGSGSGGCCGGGCGCH